MNKSLNENLNVTPETAVFLKKAAQDNLMNFCQLVDKSYMASWHHELIAQKLENALLRVHNGEKVRLILSIPPRHGKSQLASIYFPAWALGKYPDIKFIMSTYGMELSETMGMKTRDVINSESYQFIFPNVTLRPDQKAKAKWLTTEGGAYTAVGIGTAVTGTGANIILLDDPHKDRAEAESETQRKNVWEYYRSTLYSRLEGFGAVIAIMQRWHTDDLVGRLLEEQTRLEKAGEEHDSWEVIEFPAIAHNDEYDTETNTLLRKAGEPLWQSRYPLEVLTNIRQTVGVYNWTSQYQQQPISAETQVFHERFFRYYDEDDLKGKYLKYYTICDPAISQNDDADNTVVITLAKEADGPNIYRIREDAGHFTPKQTIDLIFKHREEYDSDVFIETFAFQKALKFSIEEEQRSRQKYFILKELKDTTKAKDFRIQSLIPLYERGVIFHKHSDIEYETELLQFPSGKHDDRIDACAYITTALQGGAGSSRKAKQIFSASLFKRKRAW